MEFSAEFDDFLRSGFLNPLSEDMTREQLVEILGSPNYWLGQKTGLNWRLSPIPWERSSGLAFGSAHFSFQWDKLVGCSISYGHQKVEFPSLLSYLPVEPFTFGQLQSHLQEREIGHLDLRNDGVDDTMLITEGLIRVGTLQMSVADSAEVIALYSDRGGSVPSVKMYGSQ